MTDLVDDIVPLPEHLSHCGCPHAPGMHRTTCLPAIAHDSTPLSQRDGYALGRRFRGIGWEYPFRISGALSIDVALDAFEVIKLHVDEYRRFEMDPHEGWAPWEKPMVFLCHIVEEQLDFGGVYFGAHRLARDTSSLDELRGRWWLQEGRTTNEWTPEDTERLDEMLAGIPVVHPQQATFDVGPVTARPDPWWKGRCREIAETMNLVSGATTDQQVTAWQVEQVLITAADIQSRGPRT